MIRYNVAKRNELDTLTNFLADPSIDQTFVKPLSQREQSIEERVINKYEKGVWILAKDDSRILGCLALVLRPPEIEISTYAVAESSRGQGIGSGLIDKAIEVTKERYQMYDTLILDSWEGNMILERIMQKKGFYLRESFPDPDKRPEGINTIIYARKL